MAITERTVFVTSDQKTFTERSKAELHEGRLQLSQAAAALTSTEPLEIVRWVEGHRSEIAAHLARVDKLASESNRLQAVSEPAALEAPQPVAVKPAPQPVAPQPVAPQPVAPQPVAPHADKPAVQPTKVEPQVVADPGKTTVASDEGVDTETVPALEDEDASDASARRRSLRRRRR